MHDYQQSLVRIVLRLLTVDLLLASCRRQCRELQTNICSKRLPFGAFFCSPSQKIPTWPVAGFRTYRMSPYAERKRSFSSAAVNHYAL